ncbi:MAG: hypothetical protein A3A27_00790 [Candidatus Wildermuthbacteria bacterium RIFCSPLOWO2_01_FULL_47_18]|uniref:Uncharacterized protein n=1 Tax=Candidatus Wildermuthbacteria bacterium RIFCSPLOWO2_01_FULL_47_18 TaxID=1802460 RepID=A0A1G2RLV4_9BACT|nr:MAG: hypothetical protein A3A27_00790 [Candidatus Wildermuthbacteria bacterium RIFCSPLOWO2_01_FULL_47_18]
MFKSETRHGPGRPAGSKNGTRKIRVRVKSSRSDQDEWFSEAIKLLLSDEDIINAVNRPIGTRRH